MDTQPISEEQLATLCQNLNRTLRGLVAEQAAGCVTEAGFVNALLDLEAEARATYGISINASHTFDDWTVITFRIAGESEPCASFEFSPETGEYRQVGAICRNSDPSRAPMVED